MRSPGPRRRRIIVVELLVSLLSIVNLVIVALVSTTVSSSGPAGQVVLATDVFLTPIFLADFLSRLFTAPSRRSAGDAIWWELVTITTVGYGDRYPVTFEGRIIGVFLLFAGIALFSVLTGFIANVFLAPRRRRILAPQADDSQAAIKTLRALIDEQDERNAQIRLQLDDLERVMASTPAGSDATPDRSG